MLAVIGISGERREYFKMILPFCSRVDDFSAKTNPQFVVWQALGQPSHHLKNAEVGLNLIATASAASGPRQGPLAGRPWSEAEVMLLGRACKQDSWLCWMALISFVRCRKALLSERRRGKILAEVCASNVPFCNGKGRREGGQEKIARCDQLQDLGGPANRPAVKPDPYANPST